MNNKKIPCLIITRFNLKIEFICPKRGDSFVPDFPWINEKWLDERFRLFEKYTFPSVLNQTESCKWLVLFHKSTPDKYLRIISKYASMYSFFTPLFLNDEECEHWQAYLSNYIRSNYTGQTCMTVRIDSDDMIHPNYISELLECFLSNNIVSTPCVLSIPNGIQYYETKNSIHLYNYVSNHFIAFIANANVEKNHILMFDHSQICNSKFTVIQHNTKTPFWVEIISESNYSNPFRWKISDVFIPYDISNNYKYINKLWCNHIQWITYIIKNINMLIIHKLQKIKSILYG